MDTTKKLLGLTFAAGLVLGITGCDKKPNVAPEPDKEFQSTVDLQFAQMVITDIDMICSFVAEGGNSLEVPKFYMEEEPGAVNSVTVTNDIQAKYLFVSYNNTKCIDGRVRNGTIVMNYAYTNPNARYYRDFEFEGKVSLTNYKVDGWDVTLNNSFIVTNKLASPAYDSKTTKLSWRMNGDFNLKYPADPSKNMRVNADLVKTLANTSDPAVFPVSHQSAIQWSLAVVEYKGTMFGTTSGNVDYTYQIDDKNPLARDFSCFPDQVGGLGASPSFKTWKSEFHPFTKGQASLKTGNLYPRVIAYGNEQGEYGDLAKDPKDLTYQCDNNGVVTIKGIAYPIDFKEDYK
jgi:hypothetical protein